MGIRFEAANTSANAPDIEAGLYDALYAGVGVKEKVQSQFGVEDKYIWAFALLTEDGEAIYKEDGDELEVDIMTSQNMNTASKTVPGGVKVLKALLTPVEFAKFVAGEGLDADALDRRLCQVEVYIKESGWPQVAQVLPARKSLATKLKAAAGE